MLNSLTVCSSADRAKLLAPPPPVQAMIKRNSLPLVFKPELPARFGLMPLKGGAGGDAAGGGIRWFELPKSFMAFHGGPFF
jgi:hypothetical protein